MSRTAAEGFETYIELYNRGINLKSLKEPHINADVFRAFSERVVPMTDTKVDVILDAVIKDKKEKLFQFTTERMILSIAKTCLKRIDSLNSATMIYHLANCSMAKM